jgi:hypothetical protein
MVYGAVITGALTLFGLWGFGLSGVLGRPAAQFFGDAAPGLLALALVGWLPPPARVARVVALVLLYVLGLGMAALTLGLVLLAQGEGTSAASAVAIPTTPLILLLLALLLTPTLLLSESVRSVLARWLPLGPDTFRHWVGFVVLVWFTLMPLALLPFLGGQPPLAAVVERVSAEELLQSPWAEVAQLLWTLLLCLVAAGFPFARRGVGVLDRLALLWPGWRRIALAVGMAGALAIVVVRVIGPLTTAVMTTLGVPAIASSYLEKLFGPIDVGGAVLRAGRAGLGEELIWRGLVQPRYGLVPAAVGFAAMHGFQFGPSSLVVALLVGVSLGLVRRWSNTTLAAIVHGSYDLWLLLGTALLRSLF